MNIYVCCLRLGNASDDNEEEARERRRRAREERKKMMEDSEITDMNNTNRYITARGLSKIC